MSVQEDMTASATTRAPHDNGVVLPEQAAAPDSWLRSYVNGLRWSDSFVLGAALLIAYVTRFPRGHDGVRVSNGVHASYLILSLGLLTVWCVAMAAKRTRHRRVVGTGAPEYTAVFQASWLAFSMVAIVCLALKIDIARGFLLIAFPLGTLALLLNRWLARQRLVKRRRSGRHCDRVLVVGAREQVAEMVAELEFATDAGLRVVGVCLAPGEEPLEGVETVGDFVDIADTAQRYGASLVVLTSSPQLTTDLVRHIGWDLEGTGIDLALAPALTDVAGQRLVSTPVSGTNLLHVDEPRFDGPRYVFKSVFDWVLALLITIAISPVLLVIAVLVKVTSRGPLFYTQQRVGRNGEHFGMLKFRSMVPDAHERLAEVLAAEGVEEIGMFYKPKNDPRVTPVGRVLRRYSLDELPQLFNVLRGEMSLVGPRPQIDAEVALYDRKASRRLLVRPGLTGLWQVSGRSNLEADESIRLDVYYAENWTVFGDALLLARTAKAMIAGEGAR
ncbi:Undecaprenyl-phosphate galactose phosphotransferase WbaP/exopolysaccharide biosynthesis polyprenyl glycosylphosphotransferase [Flavimobilis soli]|uniref:Undecaprenyl-phosphate galactose phosphotransferase WbaP/exopolysaccharide biosynthesis polyprenyl glycosylphosphotransferase n=1 Tax=Flavimobilis soli TaxID=442709 RepID=A0A2A9EEA6_9MICO|nr:sugar transferase [Flavimobilis soli]PFG37377.1 Undecaprenyl-phosphate galactose phosphotransferase WbaP/exopolysaccharide biosynthesis polyprenyl glycosylphosphotransferase [Flavimobilis soli]